MHTHSIFKCVEGVSIPTGHSVESTNADPLESIIKSCDNLARAAARSKTEVAYIYKVDGCIEYIISSVYFIWPNYDREWPKLEHEGSNAGKDHSEGQRLSSKPTTSRGSHRNPQSGT